MLKSLPSKWKWIIITNQPIKDTRFKSHSGLKANANKTRFKYRLEASFGGVLRVLCEKSVNVSVCLSCLCEHFRCELSILVDMKDYDFCSIVYSDLSSFHLISNIDFDSNRFESNKNKATQFGLLLYCFHLVILTTVDGFVKCNTFFRFFFLLVMLYFKRPFTLKYLDRLLRMQQ